MNSRLRQGHPLTHKCWTNMVQRCTNPNNPDYKDYGARGVVVCDRWLTSKGGSFANFLSDMGPKPDGLWLDKDKLGDGKLYSPETCCWLTPKEQMQHRRARAKKPPIPRRKPKQYEYKGRSKTIKEWAADFGITRETLKHRISFGWSVEKALTTPVRQRRKPSEPPQHQQLSLPGPDHSPAA